jgi:prostaglandin-endoperoxide synthase 2
LFPFFAQWFTDSFLRTDPVDRRKNTSNHEIDLCQIYGLEESTSDILRTMDGSGKLRHEPHNGDQYGEKLYRQDIDGLEVKDHFKDLPYIKRGDLPRVLERGNFDLNRLKGFYASGIERGNTTIVYSAISTIFRREHNRLCAELKSRNPKWDDDRLFQTARNVNITMLLKLIVEEYVYHLSGKATKFLVEIGFADKQRWYRTNRIAIEFDLLYRWHGLVPEVLEVDGEKLDHWQYMYNNPLLERHRVEEITKAASEQSAGRISLDNTPKFLEPAELGALSFARQFHIRPYNEYRPAFGFDPVRSFMELTGDADVARRLEALYSDVNKVEFGVGLLAKQRSQYEVLGKLMTYMVGVDAFSHALTNPLLGVNIFGEGTFSEIGLRTIEETGALQDIVKRNCGTFNPNDVYASFTM